MSVHFSPAVAGQIALESEADATRRIAAAEAAAALAPPSSETEEWRYSPINDLVLDAFEPAVGAPSGAIVPEPAASAVAPAAMVTVVNGWVQTIDLADAAAAAGLSVEIADSTDREGFADPDLFDRLHEAFAPPSVPPAGPSCPSRLPAQLPRPPWSQWSTVGSRRSTSPTPQQPPV